MKRILTLLLMAAAALPRVATAREDIPHFMISAAHPIAAQVGYDTLQNGGTAVDAAVAVQFMLTLVEPQSSGIGGGAFMLYWSAEEKKLYTFDGRETAPSQATPDLFLNADGQPKEWWDAVIGGRSVGIPGTLRLLETTHRRFGRLPWGELLQPTAELADKGFAISPQLADSIAAHDNPTRQLARFAATRRYFFQADGSPRPAGSILRNPAFADTVRQIAADGADPFYLGEIADDIVAAVRDDKDNPGLMSKADLADYRVKERPPVCINYRRYRLCGMGPPTSGGLTVAQILGMLERFDLPAMGVGADSAHLFAQAARLAYADRAMYMADADYVDVPVAGLLQRDYLRARSALIDPQRAATEVPVGLPPPLDAHSQAADSSPERPGTSHFVIVDREGNIVSMTTTIETGFGSRLFVRGFLLNNELTDFSFMPVIDDLPVANRVQGGKRPRSSMSPTIVFQGERPVLAVGSPGGSRIINYVAQTLIGVLDWGLSPQQAIDLGHIVNRNGDTELEEGSHAATWAAELTRRGHRVTVGELYSGLHAIQLKPHGRGLIGGADRRREGIVLGH